MDNAELLAEMKVIHAIDRLLYILLVKDLARNPYESLQIMALWFWLERGLCNLMSKNENPLGGICNLIGRIYNLPHFFINEIAEEAILCLKCINNQLPSPLSPESAIIPLTHSLVNRDISLQFFLDNSYTIFHGVQRVVSDIYLPVLSDIMEIARRAGFNNRAEPSRAVVPGPIQSPDPRSVPLAQFLSGSRIRGETSRARAGPRENEASRLDRTMFVTFSKGYPVSEGEVRRFFTRKLGRCIESFNMQEVRYGEQALYAVVVFESQFIVQMILDGEPKAKFNINGKHVWLRMYVPRGRRRFLPCGCLVGPWTGTHRP